MNMIYIFDLFDTTSTSGRWKLSLGQARDSAKTWKEQQYEELNQYRGGICDWPIVTIEPADDMSFHAYQLRGWSMTAHARCLICMRWRLPKDRCQILCKLNPTTQVLLHVDPVQFRMSVEFIRNRHSLGTWKWAERPG